MNYRRIIAFASALTMMTALVSCGKSDESADIQDEIFVSDTEDVTEAEEKSADESEKKTDEEKSAETTEKTKSKSQKSKTKTTAASSANDSTTTAAASETTAAKSGGQSSSGDTGASGGNSRDTASSGGNTSSDSGSSQETTTPAENGEQSGGGTEEQSETSGYDAEISFSGTPSVSGKNASVEGNSAVITTGGDYRITGSSSDGQIVVNVSEEEKVKIVLDGVDLTCSSGPALFIKGAKKCTVELADGSVNHLQDTAKDKVYDGVIFSNDTLRIKGGGSLDITAGNRHGIASDDNIIIESGTYTINSVKTGIFAHDGITINGGDFTINGGTNGIKSYNNVDPSKAVVEINGGNLVISGGTKEEKSSIYAVEFRYKGGNVYATGNKVTEPAETASPYAVFYYPSGGAAGSTLTLGIDGIAKVTMTPQSNYKCALILSPDIHSGSKVSSELDGKSAEFEITDNKNVFTVE